METGMGAVSRGGGAGAAAVHGRLATSDVTLPLLPVGGGRRRQRAGSSPRPLGFFWHAACTDDVQRCGFGREMGSFLLDGYDPQGFYCELLRSADNDLLRDRLAAMQTADFKRRVVGAEQALYNLGITFTVYSDANAIDRILPFDAIPRVLSAPEWEHIERGVIQRVTALNLLLDDLYHQQKILKDGIIPADLILANPNYRPVMRGVAVRHKAYVNICGTDIIRDCDGTFRVLEDNARTPSGVSCVIENRHTMLRSFPDLLDGIGLRGIDD